MIRPLPLPPLLVVGALADSLKYTISFRGVNMPFWPNMRYEAIQYTYNGYFKWLVFEHFSKVWWTLNTFTFIPLWRRKISAEYNIISRQFFFVSTFQFLSLYMYIFLPFSVINFLKFFIGQKWFILILNWNLRSLSWLRQYQTGIFVLFIQCYSCVNTATFH